MIDTNILIFGLFFRGLLKEFLIKLDFEKFKVCVNKEIINEYKEQIQKKLLNPKYILNRDLREKIFGNFNHFEKVSDLKICRDPDDDKYKKKSSEVGGIFF